jgi:hypothetical protein
VVGIAPDPGPGNGKMRHTMSKRLRAGAAGLLTAAALAVLGPAAGAATPAPRTDAGTPAARSVLIITLPATSWLDIRSAMPPALSRLFRTSALADLSTRTVSARTAPGPGYLAVGTGARSVAPGDTAATNLAPDEDYQGLPAHAVFRTRTGHRLPTGIGALGWPQVLGSNAQQSYDAAPGALGTSLAAAGFGRFVIGNADETDVTGTVLHRESATVLTDGHGRVPGRVTGLLRADPTAPYGLRLDNDAVERAFPADFATRRQAVAVDASDLARADSYRPLASPRQRNALHATALASSDELVGRLLQHVDLRRDAVVVVAPFHAARARTLTVAAIHAPGVAPGLAESATTRRAGFLQIVDIAPTILDLVGVNRPDAMEGRPAEYHATGDTYRARLDQLVRYDRAAQFRDATIGQATAILVTITISMSVLTALWYRYGRGHRRSYLLTTVLRVASLGFLGYITATFLVGALPVYRWGTGTYFTLVVLLALAFAGLCLLLGRRHFLDPVLIALGVIVTMHLGDLVSGQHLELNTVFGYTPTVGIRLSGIGNPGSAQLSAAALLFAVLITARTAGRAGLRIGLAVLGTTLVVVGAPIWGQDYGGALALGPTIVLWWLLRSGRRIRARTVLIIGGVLVAIGVLVGLIDLSRPADSRTHVGRFFEKVGKEGPTGFLTVVGRKLSLMLGTFSNTAWVLAVLSVAILLLLAALRTDVFPRLSARIPTLPTGLLCYGVLVVLATALNDSGVQVTGMMAATLLPVLVFLACGEVADPVAGAAPSAAPGARPDAPELVATGRPGR